MSFSKISITNNDTTGMEDVVVGLQYTLGFSQKDAFEAMMRVHKGSTEVVAHCRNEDVAFFEARFHDVNRSLENPFEVAFAPLDATEKDQLVLADAVPNTSFDTFRQDLLARVKRSNTLVALAFLALVGFVVFALVG